MRAARCGPSLLTVTPYVEAVASAMLSQGWAEVAADVTEAHINPPSGEMGRHSVQCAFKLACRLAS